MNGYLCGIVACLVLQGCSLGNRVERMAVRTGENFAREYVERSNPNLVSNDRYQSLRKFGELQRKVELGLYSRREALDRLDQSDYDQAFDAVQNIARSAAQDAFRQVNSEVRLVERFTTLNIRRDGDSIDDVVNARITLGTSFSDFTSPKFNLSSSFTDGRIELRPAIKLGNLYGLSYSTKSELFEHDVRLRYERFLLQVRARHELHRFRELDVILGVAVSDLSYLSLSYKYVREGGESVFGFGFSAQW